VAVSGDGLITLERARMADAAVVATAGEEAKLTVHLGRGERAGGRPAHIAVGEVLHRHGVAGATALRGIRGYHGGHAPHGDSFRQLRRRVPVVTVIVDTPEHIARWFAIVDALTDETGLVTSEQVPALRTAGPGIVRGGLRLADPGVR
jgi:PII-like signaling protein